MFHCNGWCTPWAVTAIGGTHVCLREVRGDVIWRLIREHGVTHLNGAPTVVTTILRGRGRRQLDDSRSSSPPRARRRRPTTIMAHGATWASGSCTSTGSPRPTGRTR